MDQRTLVEMLFTTAVATVAGGLTDTVSIFMLFRPYEPKGIGRLTIQGALPKNKARLARSIGKTVGERLLTPADLHARLNAPEVRATFAEAIGAVYDDLLTQERGGVRTHLSPRLRQELDRIVAHLAAHAADRLSAWLVSPEGTHRVAGWLARLMEEIRDRPVGAILSAAQRDALRERAARVVAQVAEGPELERALRTWLADEAASLATDERPLLSRLPAGIVGAVEHAIADYIPLALERLGGLLAEPAARHGIERALRDALDGSVRDLLLHERLLAKLVVSGRTIERLVDGFERDGFERFAEAFMAPAMKAQLAHAVREAVIGFLVQPTNVRLAALGPERRDAVVAALGDWLVGLARDPATRRVATAAADRALDALEQRTWGELLGTMPAEEAARVAAAALAGPEGRRLVEEAVRTAADRLLDQPLGRPAEWLGAEAAATLRAEAIEAAWVWIEAQIPRVVQQIRVEEIIEQKVNELPIERVERLIRDVSQKELDLIVRIGYLLGGLFGFCAFWLAKAVGF